MAEGDRDFQEIDLSPDNELSNHSQDRPHSTSKLHKFFNSTFRKTQSRKKRRATAALTDNELIKNSISLPNNCEHIPISEEDVTFSTSIQSCPFDITGYGPFLLMDEFKVYKPKKMTLMVFLYEKIIIFTKKEENQESYYYVGSLNMEQIGVMPQTKNSRDLELKNHLASSRFHKETIYTLRASSEYIQMQWRKAIEQCLWKQLLKAKNEGGIVKNS